MPGLRVLLCDDHRMFAEALSVVLQNAGHDVVAITEDPTAARDAAARTHPDIVLLDLHFPGISGTGALLLLTDGSPDFRLMVLSADIDPRDVSSGIDRGVTGFVLKNKDVDEILACIERVVSGEVVIDATLLRGAIQRVEYDEEDEVRQLAQFLTSREREVLGRLVRGESTAAVAEGMGIAYSTARTHIQSVLTKLGAHSRLEVAALAVAHDLVRLPEGARTADRERVRR